MFFMLAKKMKRWSVYRFIALLHRFIASSLLLPSFDLMHLGCARFASFFVLCLSHRTVNPLTTSAKSCSNWAEILSTASFIYLKKYHILCFDFLSRTVKKLLAILCFLFMKIYDSARFNNMFQNSVLGSSLMSEELIEL